MGEKIAKTGVQRDKGLIYYIKGGDVWGSPLKKPGMPKGKAQKIAATGVDLDYANFMYYLSTDKNGDPRSSAPAVRSVAASARARRVARRRPRPRRRPRRRRRRRRPRRRRRRRPAARRASASNIALVRFARTSRMGLPRGGPFLVSAPKDPMHRVFAVAFHRRGEAPSTFTRGASRAGDGSWRGVHRLAFACRLCERPS